MAVVKYFLVNKTNCFSQDYSVLDFRLAL